MTYNEERRVPNLLRYYGDRFDVVLLDGDSNDTTVQVAVEMGATVFRRLGQEAGERYVVHYVNEGTCSGICFYLLADEFIMKSNLEAIELELGTHASVVLGNKAEWMYGRRMLTVNHVEPRGFRKGYARYADQLHMNLQFWTLPDTKVSERIFDVHHLHIWSVQNHFGKIGLYSYIEIEQFRKNKRPIWRFFHRYVASLIGFPLTKVWRERGIGIPRALFWVLFDLAELAIAALSWIEQTCLMNPEDQLTLYAEFYSESPPSTGRLKGKGS